MGVVVIVAALATVLLGGDAVRSSGPGVVFLAWILFDVGLLIVTFRAWRNGTATLAMVAPLLASFLPVLILPIAFLFPGDIGYFVFLSLPLTAVGWLWIAIAWFRGQGAWLSTP